MSCVYKGQVLETELSKNARGGTEMMRDRLLRNVPRTLLEKYAIHLSRPRQLHFDVKNIFWCHDLPDDPENKTLENDGWRKFDFFVFVSQWQRDGYIEKYKIPYPICAVIPNAIETTHTRREKPTDKIRFIYHTTPHRGLTILYPIFEALCKEHDNIELDVFSSFEVYGWKQRDAKFQNVFDRLNAHPKINYHGAVDNSTVLDYLQNRSNIFLYPCVWKETSCIAMIEAMRSSCMVIHPNLGALSETSEGMSVMYDYTEDINRHAKISYQTTNHILNIEKSNKGFINNTANKEKYAMEKNSINTFKSKWISILENLKDG